MIEDDGMVEWVCKCGNSYKHRCGKSLPPSTRPAVFWDGLSADEISDLIPRTDLSGDYGYGDMFAIARLVEYKLKEKNEKTN